MTLKITKNTQQLREKLTQVEKPSGIAGEAMLRANTVRDQANLLGYAPDNIIINGDMKVAQRGTSTTTADGFLVDRFKTTNGTGGSITTTQESDGPHTKDGHFKYYTQLNVTQADTSLASTEWGGIFYIIEGNDWDWFNYGTANAETATLSFWHCHNVAGTYCVTLRNQGGGSNRNYVVEYTQDIADEWQKTVIVFPGDFSGTWTTGTGGALSILFTYANGSAYHANSVTETNKWFGGTYYHSTENQVNLMSAANNKFRLTGVQLVRGNHPDGLPFQFRHYSEELLRCQRYYYKRGATVIGDRFCSGNASSTTDFRGFIEFPVEMRANPTFETSGTASHFSIVTGTNGVVTCNGVPTAGLQKWGGLINAETASGLTAGHGGQLRASSTSAYIAVSAEL